MPKTEKNHTPAEPLATDESAAKITELTNDLQRTRADFENFRKNIEKERENVKQLATHATILKLLPLLDDIDRAIATYPELAPLAKSLDKSLASLSLAKINTTAGTEFDPTMHEAVMTEGDGDKETIGETLRAGYLYEGEVLRPAMVRVKLA